MLLPEQMQNMKLSYIPSMKIERELNETVQYLITSIPEADRETTFVTNVARKKIVYLLYSF